MNGSASVTGLNGRVALVTGGGRGLGAAICTVLAEAGATVVCADVRLDLAEAVAQRLCAAGAAARALWLDVTDAAVAGQAVQTTLDTYGQLDVLVNNAGVDVTLPVEELTLDQWDHILAVNLRGPFLMAKLAFPLMRRQGGGHIVNIVSTAALRAWANATAYHASKWGLLGLSRALHVEGVRHGIKITAVIAGGMRTPFLLERFPDIDPAVLQEPRTVAETVRFVLTQPHETVIPEVMVLPVRETSWP
jgi:NAD(P)-dependent dehydrogenase (short-subunit alcohol dehydrogenase family)